MEPKIREKEFVKLCQMNILQFSSSRTRTKRIKHRKLKRKKNPIPSVLSKGAPKLFAEIGKGKFKTKIKNGRKSINSSSPRVGVFAGL